MTSFEVRVPVTAPAAVVWQRLVDWPTHGQWMPVTRVRVTTPPADEVGARLVARTGLGPVALVDPMVISVWRPPARDQPGHCVLDKTGRLVHGSASFSVEPCGAGACLVRWREQVTIGPQPWSRLLAPMAWLVGLAMFRLAIRRFARAIERAAVPPGAGDAPAASR